jgi:GDP-L-fucose synthase
MDKNSKIYIAGHSGMVGSAIVRLLERQGYKNLLKVSSKNLDLRNQLSVKTFFEKEKPDYVFLSAAKVGGIHANNTYRAEFIYDNLMIQSNIIHQSFLNGVKKLLFLGSSCIYPKFAPQPLKEESLLSGFLEKTNQPYAIAKIAGIELCNSYRVQYGCNFISAMPTNLYGPNDNYDIENSHVLPALLRKFITAKRKNNPQVEIWGTGNPRREFMHVDDLADACLFLMNNYSEIDLVNIGTGTDVSIKTLAEIVKGITGYIGEIKWDSTRPDGTPQKLLSTSKLKSIGWVSGITLKEGIQSVYDEVKNIIW